MQLCYVVPSQPQVDDMVNVAAVLNRWHLVVLHEVGSGELWRARVSDLVHRPGGKAETKQARSIPNMAGHGPPSQVKIFSMPPDSIIVSLRCLPETSASALTRCFSCSEEFTILHAG